MTIVQLLAIVRLLSPHLRVIMDNGASVADKIRAVIAAIGEISRETNSTLDDQLAALLQRLDEAGLVDVVAKLVEQYLDNGGLTHADVDDALPPQEGYGAKFDPATLLQLVVLVAELIRLFRKE